jgi:hypothetical protein
LRNTHVLNVIVTGRTQKRLSAVETVITFSAWVPPVAGRQANVSRAAVFHVFPIAAAAGFYVDEQAFILTPETSWTSS